MKNKFREIRVIKRVTQEKLERETGIDQARISLFENGHIEFPAEQKKKLARALRVRMADVWPKPLTLKKSTILTSHGKKQSADHD